LPRQAKTATASRGEASLYQAKGEQFLEEARLALKSSRHDAAMLNAIHAAISATDAVTVALSGRRSTDPDHQRAVDLLEEIGGRSESITARVKQLRALLAKKNQVEYEARRGKAGEATDAVARAVRIVEWAGETVRRAGL
jgi:HEPN domain-containing protein